MKKFLFVALGALFALAMYAAPPADVGKPQSNQVLLIQQADAHPIVVDFLYADFSVITNATATEMSYEIYQAMPAEVSEPKFRMEMPVFRLCKHNHVAVDSQVLSPWMARSNLPPNRQFRARMSIDARIGGRLAQMVEQVV